MSEVSHGESRGRGSDLASPGTGLIDREPELIRGAFASIAGRYDLANHFLSGGADFLWRSRAARMIARKHPRRILDLATGSGDLAIALGRACPGAEVVGGDFCLPMLEVARRKCALPLVCADALHLPFHDAVFDAVTVAFGLRNMVSWDGALREMARVLVPGGTLLVMDFSMPETRLFLPLYRFYLHRILPHLAGVLTGQSAAYAYLGESIEAFPRGEAMLGLIRSCGFGEAARHSLFFGIAAIYTGRRLDISAP